MKQTMKTELKIFFAWQTSSKTDSLNNKEFIWSCIQKAADEITSKGDLKDVTFKVLQGTGGEPGTPNMIATCLRRNDECHIFIADISVDKRFSIIQKWVNRQPKLRERPNENVMYELGRADGHLNYKQVIHVANTVFGDVSKNDYLRPVDIRDKRRPITFKLTSNNAPDAEKVKVELTEDLKTALKKSAKAALDHIHEELKPYDSCEQTIKELDFKEKFIYNDHLRSIKRAISENSGILRLYGLNGVGKTRLVLETILSEQTDTPKLYCDCLLAEEQRVLDTTIRIFEKEQSAILILDNCDADLFTKLLTIYKRKKVQHRIYAIVDVPEESRIDSIYNIARFEYSYEDVVDGIIASQYGKQDEVSHKIKEFASGNPLIAVQTIEGVKKTGDVREFNNEKLITNILSAAAGSEERVIAETLSLFTDAEIPKDIPEYLICGDFAGDGAEVVEGFAEVLGEEVGGDGRSGRDRGIVGNRESVTDAAQRRGGVLEGFEVTGVGHQRGFGGDVEVAPGTGEGMAQVFQADAGFGGDDVELPAGGGQERGESAACLGCRFHGHGVGLVEQEDQLLLFRNPSGDILCAGRQVLQRGRQVQCRQHQLGGGEFFIGPLDTDAFDGVVTLAQAGRIDETEEHTVQVAGLLDRVARGAGNVRNDGAVLAEKCIEKCAFT